MKKRSLSIFILFLSLQAMAQNEPRHEVIVVFRSEDPSLPEEIPGQIRSGLSMRTAIVKSSFERRRSLFEARQIAGRGASILRSYPHVGAMKIQVDGDAHAFAEQLMIENPNVIAEVNSTVSIMSYQALESNNWGLNSQLGGGYIFSEEAQDLHVTTHDVTVAIIDTGIDGAHPDLRNFIWRNSDEIPNNGIDDDQNGYVDDVNGFDFLGRDNVPSDANGHGTHVAGIVASTGGFNLRQRLMPLRFLDGAGNGDIAAGIEAIDYAIANGAHVINLSWGGNSNSVALRNAIANAYQFNIPVFAAAGNDGQSNDVSPTYPASFDLPNLMAVAATDSSDRLANISNWGTRVVLGAPGVSIYSTLPGSDFGYLTGTSMATPFVTAVAAMILSASPNLNLTQVLSAIKNGVDTNSSLQGRVSSRGRLNALKSLRNALQLVPEPLPHFSNSNGGFSMFGCGTIQTRETFDQLRLRDVLPHLIVLLMPLAFVTGLRVRVARGKHSRSNRRYAYATKVVLQIDEGQVIVANSSDISESGIGVSGNFKVHVGQKMNVRIQIDHQRWVDVEATVQWTKPHEGKIGLNFEAKGESAKFRIRHLVMTLAYGDSRLRVGS